DLDKRSEGGDAQHFSVHNIADAMLGEERLPYIGLELLDAEREAPVIGFNGQHHRLDLVTLLENLRRMLDALGPAHLADVDQALNTLFQLNESSVIGDADNASPHMSADGITLRGIEPRVRRELLETQ